MVFHPVWCKNGRKTLKNGQMVCSLSSQFQLSSTMWGTATKSQTPKNPQGQVLWLTKHQRQLCPRSTLLHHVHHQASPLPPPSPQSTFLCTQPLKLWRLSSTPMMRLKDPLPLFFFSTTKTSSWKQKTLLLKRVWVWWLTIILTTHRIAKLSLKIKSEPSLQLLIFSLGWKQPTSSGSPLEKLVNWREVTTYVQSKSFVWLTLALLAASWTQQLKMAINQ